MFFFAPLFALLMLTTAVPTLSSTPVPRSEAALDRRAAANGHTVAIVKVPAPWYAFDFLLAREFTKVLPLYEKADGLRFKAFSSIETKNGKCFGGIYLWNSETQARRWYSPTWFADVEQKRGHRPEVLYYAVAEEVSFVAQPFDYHRGEGDCVTVFVHALTPMQRRSCLARQAGLLRTYVVREARDREGALLLFAAAGQATAFLAQQRATAYDWFNTPVLLNNVK